MNGRTDLYRLDNHTLTPIRYQDEILGPIVRPYSRAMGSGFLLVHDNAWSRVARVCKVVPGAGGIVTIDWPPCSPNLNPIEHPWTSCFGPSDAAMLRLRPSSDAMAQI